MTKKELLKNANIKEQEWEYCYIVDDVIYTPMYNENLVMTKNGEEVYAEQML